MSIVTLYQGSEKNNGYVFKASFATYAGFEKYVTSETILNSSDNYAIINDENIPVLVKEKQIVVWKDVTDILDENQKSNGFAVGVVKEQLIKDKNKQYTEIREVYKNSDIYGWNKLEVDTTELIKVLITKEKDQTTGAGFIIKPCDGPTRKIVISGSKEIVIAEGKFDFIHESEIFENNIEFNTYYHFNKDKSIVTVYEKNDENKYFILDFNKNYGIVSLHGSGYSVDNYLPQRFLDLD